MGGLDVGDSNALGCRVRLVHLECLRNEFRVVQSGTFHLAEHVPEKMLALNETLRGLGVPPDPAVLADFQRQAAEMKLWLRTNSLSVTTAHQRELLSRIEAALDDYVAKRPASCRRIRGMPPARRQNPSWNAWSKKPHQSLPCPSNCGQRNRRPLIALSKSHGAPCETSAIMFSSPWQWRLLLGFAALRLIHVARIAPLKAKLVQSHSILEQQEKLASLGTLAAGVAHEVRNPLTAIKVRLHSLKRAMPGNPSAADDLSVIHDEIKRLERLVGDFMQLPARRRPRCRPSPPRLCSSS